MSEEKKDKFGTGTQEINSIGILLQMFTVLCFL